MRPMGESLFGDSVVSVTTMCNRKIKELNLCGGRFVNDAGPFKLTQIVGSQDLRKLRSRTLEWIAGLRPLRVPRLRK